jgi:hypothetical protein
MKTAQMARPKGQTTDNKKRKRHGRQSNQVRHQRKMSESVEVHQDPSQEAPVYVEPEIGNEAEIAAALAVEEATAAAAEDPSQENQDTSLLIAEAVAAASANIAVNVEGTPRHQMRNENPLK